MPAGSAPEYAVDCILAERLVRGSLRYKVQWHNYTNTTWEPASNLSGCAALDQWRVRPGLGTFSVTMHGSRSHLTDVLSIPGIPRSKLHTVSNLLALL